eukprot:scaffold285875_cov27-Tisochrysis_lutea.AAC.1
MRAASATFVSGEKHRTATSPGRERAVIALNHLCLGARVELPFKHAPKAVIAVIGRSVQVQLTRLAKRITAPKVHWHVGAVGGGDEQLRVPRRDNHVTMTAKAGGDADDL